jgi:phosphonate transport system permease protein
LTRRHSRRPPRLSPPLLAKPPFPWRGWLAALIVLLLLWWSAVGTGFSAQALVEGFPEIFAFFHKLLPSPETPWPWDYLPQIRLRMLETIKIAVAATFFGSALALPYALIGARNLAGGRFVYAVGRTILNLVRTVPDLILATLLASVFGIGPLPGLLALVVFTFGVVAKLLCDTVETVDPGPVEAITATGGTRLQRAVFAALPQVAPDFAAYSLYAFEVNIRAAAVLGLVGAGGIGTILQRDISFFHYANVGLIIAATFVVVLILDTLSTWLRSRLV